MDKDKLREYVLNNPQLVSMKPSKTYQGLSVVKYKNKCFYDNIWNKYLEACRGLVVDEDFNIVINPFKKIYNYGIESRAPRIAGDTEVLAVRKINGFMAAVSIYKGELIVSTTGSLDSDYAKLARKWIETIDSRFFDDKSTILFEIVDKSDPHIIPETEGIYVLGYRNNILNSPISHLSWFVDESERSLYGAHYPEQFVTILNDLREKVKTVKHEGYVGYTKNGDSFKIKSPYYLVSKLFARKKNLEVFFKKNVKEIIAEEYYLLADHIKSNMDYFSSLDEQARLNYIRDYLENYL